MMIYYFATFSIVLLH